MEIRRDIIATGNIFDGITLIGPFSNRDDAIEWAEDELGRNQDWWHTNLESPGDYE
jgi:hypothetical protein